LPEKGFQTVGARFSRQRQSANRKKKINFMKRKDKNRLPLCVSTDPRHDAPRAAQFMLVQWVGRYNAMGILWKKEREEETKGGRKGPWIVPPHSQVVRGGLLAFGGQLESEARGSPQKISERPVNLEEKKSHRRAMSDPFREDGKNTNGGSEGAVSEKNEKERDQRFSNTNGVALTTQRDSIRTRYIQQQRRSRFSGKTLL